MLALVSFTSTVYPSLIGTRPPSRLILSKHKDTRPRAHTSTARPARTHPAGLAEHLEELIQCADKRFLESTKETVGGASNSPPLLTQTHTHAYTHTRMHARLLTAEVKARSDGAEGTKSVFLQLDLKVLQHFRLAHRAQGPTFIAARVWSTHLHVYFQPGRVPGPPGGTESGAAWPWSHFIMTRSSRLASNKPLQHPACRTGSSAHRVCVNSQQSYFCSV